MIGIETNLAPRIVHRECGGFLALSDTQASLKIGVTAPTEEEAVARFHAAIEAGWALLASPVVAGVALSATDSVAASSA